MATIGVQSRKTIRAAGQTAPALDPVIVSVVTILLMIGAIMVYSAALPVSARSTGNNYHFLLRHLVHMMLGLTAVFLILRTRISMWEKLGPWLLLAGLISLVLVLVPGIGVKVNGSSRWINLGIANIQPSEFVKIFVVIYLSGYLVRRQDKLREFVPGIVMIGLVVALIGVLLIQEPDLGSLAVVSMTVLGMMFLAGVRFMHFVVIVLAGVGCMVVLTMIAPYRMHRIAGFIDPWADPFNSGFQLVQALIAFGRGEWFGVGLGASVQKLSYLPAAHTDFLLSILAEELGLVGILFVIVLFAILIHRALWLSGQALNAGQVYSARLCQGIALLLGLQALINMGVNMGILPTKGLTLPFMSYGGSSLIASCIAAGFLLLVGKELREKSWPKK